MGCNSAFRGLNGTDMVRMRTGEFVLVRDSKAIWGVKLWLQSLLSSALDGDGWLASRSGRFIPSDIDQIAHWTGLVAPTAGLNDLRKRKSLFSFAGKRSTLCRFRINCIMRGMSWNRCETVEKRRERKRKSCVCLMKYESVGTKRKIKC